MADELSRGLSTKLPNSANLESLFSNLRVIAVASAAPASVGGTRDVWVSVIFGSNFVTAPTSQTLRLGLGGLAINDVMRENLQAKSNQHVGILALDFPSRRRFRTNGVVHKWPESRGPQEQCGPVVLEVSVREAFPNCPKYIQKREVTSKTRSLPPLTGVRIQRDVILSEADKAIISNSDTFFLGTHFVETGLDVNHRGGQAGFVRICSDNEIYWPDYRGNGMFQSFGNLEMNDRAGVTFVDFTSGSVLQLSGSAKVEWKVESSRDIEAAAERIVRFHIDAVSRSEGPLTNYRWETFDYSPYNPALPFKNQEDSRLQSDGFPMEVSLVKIVNESPNVKTFRFLAPRYISFLPGQYATFEFGAQQGLDGGSSTSIVRTWTLSEVANSTRGDVTLEVSVKRKVKGLVSNWLHDRAQLGLRIKLLGVGGEMSPFNEAMAPDKLLCISGGIGITPNMAILRGIGARLGGQGQTQPDVMFVHQERYEDNVPFKRELHRRAQQSGGNVRLLILLSSGEMSDGSEHKGTSRSCENIQTIPGRVNADILETNVADIHDRVVYLCGPLPFMAAVGALLRSLGVSENRIITEQFDF